MKSLFLLFTLLVTFDVNAKRVLIGFGEHPHVSYYKDIIKVSYQKLGYEVLFTELVNERRIVALNAGMVDAIVIATGDITGNIENIRRVEQLLTEGSGYLICQKSLPCDSHVLADPNVKLLSTRQSYLQTQNKYLGQFNAKLLQFERSGAIIELLAAGRANYGIYYVDTRGLPAEVFSQFNHAAITEIQGFHYIHKRMAIQQAEITQAIKETQQEIERHKSAQ